MRVGVRIRQRRHLLGLSQRALEQPGVSYAYISRIEAGARTPSIRALRKIAPQLGVSVHWLETGELDPLAVLSEAARLLVSLEYISPSEWDAVLEEARRVVSREMDEVRPLPPNGEERHGTSANGGTAERPASSAGGDASRDGGRQGG